MAQTLPLHHQKVPTATWSPVVSNNNAKPSAGAASATTSHTLNINVEPGGQIYFDASDDAGTSATKNDRDNFELPLSPVRQTPAKPPSARRAELADVGLTPKSRRGENKPLSPAGVATPSSSASTKLGDDSLLTNRSSFHSSGGLRSPDETDLKWTQFNDDSETEETPGSRRHSESEARNLLADELLSDADDSHASSFDPNEEMTDGDQSFEISPELKSYYLDKFKTLLYASTGIRSASLAEIRQSALKGTDHAVQEFFHKSQLSKTDLSKIWYLSDVNRDGHLNFDEFMVAMHLIVRRVKGNYDIPKELPVEFRPPVTPPRTVTPQPHDAAADVTYNSTGKTSAPRWAEFVESPPQPPPLRISSATGGDTSGAGGDVAAVGETAPTLKFTSIPPADHNSTMAHPKARRGSPDSATRQQRSTSSGGKSPFGGGSAAAGPLPPIPRPRPSTSSGADSTSATVTSSSAKTKSSPPPARLVLSPQTPNPPKGPPPKPPPRPPQRHTRSVSLDLNKNRLAELGSPPAAAANAAAAMATSSESAAADYETLRVVTCDAQVQTFHNETLTTGAAAPMLDLDTSFDRTPDHRGAANDVIAASATDDEATTAVLEWKKRCTRLARVNESLERELQSIVEVRFGLEEELKRMQQKF